ncbi:MAG TPA: hypothetical protein VMK16_19600 [Acidimicrobiales bacterium]|nr:hypothetical protein [Acidimicrobiales bacterium]
MIIKLSWIGTAIFAVTATAATIDPDLFASVAFVVAMTLFFIGCVVFFLAYFQAIGRSREVDIGIGGLFFLAGSAPRPVQLHLLGSLGAEVVVAFATASIRPFTSLAFGMLVPLYGLSMCGLWAARHGTFSPRSAA